MDTSYKNHSNMKLHIPDEYLAVWKDKSVTELMTMLDRVEGMLHNYNLGASDRATTSRIRSDLEKYINSRLSKVDRDQLDLFN